MYWFQIGLVGAQGDVEDSKTFTFPICTPCVAHVTQISACPSPSTSATTGMSEPVPELQGVVPITTGVAPLPSIILKVVSSRYTNSCVPSWLKSNMVIPVKPDASEVDNVHLVWSVAVLLYSKA